MNSYLPTGPDTCLSILASCDRYSQEVMIISFKSCESLPFSNLFQRHCPSVLLEDKQKGSGTFWRNMVILEPFEFEVNQHPVAEVMPVLLKSGQHASREEAVEKMKDCQSMKQH
ncbi:hypothetical protein F2Q69_00013077 [Brassica cretica]|uniref:Uncharacterized protein n=1 Tax=Brassica cretica TaxID=69181 RepID=A0A8S9QLR0_BRACR|nr:hypothetical protein F2Q69_00013077 [Brassica cretica]